MPTILFGEWRFIYNRCHRGHRSSFWNDVWHWTEASHDDNRCSSCMHAALVRTRRRAACYANTAATRAPAGTQLLIWQKFCNWQTGDRRGERCRVLERACGNHPQASVSARYRVSPSIKLDNDRGDTSRRAGGLSSCSCGGNPTETTVTVDAFARLTTVSRRRTRGRASRCRRTYSLGQRTEWKPDSGDSGRSSADRARMTCVVCDGGTGRCLLLLMLSTNGGDTDGQLSQRSFDRQCWRKSW